MSKQNIILIVAYASISLVLGVFPAHAECARVPATADHVPSSGPALQLYGTVREVKGNQVVVALRSGNEVTVDATGAMAAQESAVLFPQQRVEIVGTKGPGSEVRADLIRRAPGAPDSWPQDCVP
jgi:hypothetical protein